MPDPGNPHVSVVIPLYNGKEFILRSVKSVLNQSFTDFELIVVDDGSTDGGGNTVGDIKDGRVRLVRQTNAGVSSARNRGIAESNGIFIAFLDADDEWDSAFLEAIVNLTKSCPAAGLYSTGYRMVYPKGPDVEVTISDRGGRTALYVHDYFKLASQYAFIHTSGVVIPAGVIRQAGTFLDGLKHGEDLEMWARIAVKFPLAYDRRVLFSFHQTGVEGKPRYRECLGMDPVLSTLRNLAPRWNSCLGNRDSIETYMSSHFKRTCWSWVTMKNCDALTHYMDMNGMRFCGFSASTIGRIKPVWLGLRFLSLWTKAGHSRTTLRFLDGRKNMHGVTMRISPRGTRSKADCR